MKKIISVMIIAIVLISSISVVYALDVTWNGTVPPFPKSFDFEAYRPNGYRFIYVLGYEYNNAYQYSICYSYDPMTLTYLTNFTEPDVRTTYSSGYKVMLHRENLDGTPVEGTTVVFASSTEGGRHQVIGKFINGTFTNGAYQGDGQFVQHDPALWKIIYADHNLDLQGYRFYTAEPPPPVDVTNPDEYIRVVSPPRDNWETTNKIIVYRIEGRMKSPEVPFITITNLAGTLLTQDNQIFSAMLSNRKDIKDGEYYNVSMDMIVKYNANVIGTQGIKVRIEDSPRGRAINTNRTINIKAFIDSNSDGKDDTTAETPWTPDYSQQTANVVNDPTSWINDTATSVKQWITDSTLWIANVSAFFGAIFGFLPNEIQGAITVTVSVVFLFTLLSIIRG